LFKKNSAITLSRIFILENYGFKQCFQNNKILFHGTRNLRLIYFRFVFGLGENQWKLGCAVGLEIGNGSLELALATIK